MDVFKSSGRTSCCSTAPGRLTLFIQRSKRNEASSDKALSLGRYLETSGDVVLVALCLIWLEWVSFAWIRWVVFGFGWNGWVKLG